MRKHNDQVDSADVNRYTYTAPLMKYIDQLFVFYSKIF